MKLTHSLLIAVLSLGIISCSNTDRGSSQDNIRRVPASSNEVDDRRFYLEPGMQPLEKCQRSSEPRTC